MFPSHTGVCSCVTEFWLEMEKWNWCVQLQRYSLKEKDLPFSCLLLSAVWLPEQPLCCSCPLCCCDMLFMSLSHVLLLVTPWTAAHQASLPIINSQSLLKLMSIESVMPSNHLILCHPLLLLPSIFPSIRVFSSESVLHIRWPKKLELQLQDQSFQWIFRTNFL